MNDNDGSSEDEFPQDYAAPISALPPRVVQQEESQMEVSASPAFQCLDDVSIHCLIEWSFSSFFHQNLLRYKFYVCSVR